MVSVGQDDHVSSVEVIPRECFADADRRRFDAAGRELRLGSRPAARFSWLSRPDFYSTENSEEPKHMMEVLALSSVTFLCFIHDQPPQAVPALAFSLQPSAFPGDIPRLRDSFRGQEHVIVVY